MLTQNFLKSDERRRRKRVLLSQKEEEEIDSFCTNVKELLEQYGMDIDEIDKMEKSELKRKIKEKINIKMEKNLQRGFAQYEKLRFITDFSCKRKQYLEVMSGSESMFTLKTRLNMQPVYANFKADCTLKKFCEHCCKFDDTTEHLIECQALGDTF